MTESKQIRTQASQRNGAERKEIMFCNQCGTQLVDGSSFCPTCGAGNGASGPAQAVAVYQQPLYQQPHYQQPQASASQKSKMVAGLLGIFLGGWGFHKFYLGYGKEGGIMLAAWVIGAILIFALGIGVLAIAVVEIVGIVEGIIYLTKNEDEFLNTYVYGSKPWF